MYKDKHLQKEANRLASQRRRDKKKGMTLVPEKGMTSPGMTPGYDAPSVTRPNETSHKPGFADLPADVQASIERMCAENNNGARAASHSRAAMTERALAYQAMFGKRPGKFAETDRIMGRCFGKSICHTCGGPVQSPKIVKCLKCGTGTPAPKPTPTVEPETDGPLSVYSPHRWAYLQSRGYVWDMDTFAAWDANHQTEALPVPGDPAYEADPRRTAKECRLLAAEVIV